MYGRYAVCGIWSPKPIFDTKNLMLRCQDLEDGNLSKEWDYPMCPGNGTIQCALAMGLVNVPWE